MKITLRIALFVVLVGVIAVISLSSRESSIPEATKIQRAFLAEIKNDMSSGQYDRALPKIRKQLKSSPDSSPNVIAWLHVQASEVHRHRRHFHFAIDALQEAGHALGKPKQYQLQINGLQSVIDSQQNERQLKSDYRDARQSGMSKTLTKNITLAYVYLDDNRWSKWSGKIRLQNRANLAKVTSWYQDQAKDYGVDDLNIKIRYFFINSPKGLGKEWIRRPEFFDYAHGLLVRQLGFSNFTDFTESLSRGHDNSDVALVFHSNADARSFARSCHKIRTPQRCNVEYVMLTEKMNNGPHVWAIPQVQSHEILHLFGAADLYNIAAAKDYAVTDIMNYYSRELKHATIEPITAWSIGWSPLPQTPFTVNIVED